MEDRGAWALFRYSGVGIFGRQEVKESRPSCGYLQEWISAYIVLGSDSVIHGYLAVFLKQVSLDIPVYYNRNRLGFVKH